MATGGRSNPVRSGITKRWLRGNLLLTVLLVVLVVLVMCICYFKLLLEPINDSIADYQMKASAEQDEIVANTALLTKMNNMKKELAEIYAAGDPIPVPEYNNYAPMLTELNAILSTAADYDLRFGDMTLLDGDYIYRRPVTMTFRTDTYAQARAIIDALHDSRNINLISDVQVAMQETDGKASVQVSMTVTYYELKK